MSKCERFENPPYTALVRGADRDSVRRALCGEVQTTLINAAGRGAITVFPMEDGEGVLRRCRRGGLIGKIVNEGYILANRPLAEFRVHDYLFDSGISVPEPLGVVWEQRGFVFRGAFATRRLDAESLRDRIQGESRGDLRLLESIGQLIRSMHDAGVYHADLHVENILLDDSTAYLIDFDNARRYDSLGGVPRARNLLRLRRSFQKRNLPIAAYAAILSGYGDVVVPAWLDAAYRIKGKASDLLAAS